ncbi:hypothetical protein Tco_0487420 [Tanacetum coccineum]
MLLAILLLTIIFSIAVCVEWRRRSRKSGGGRRVEIGVYSTKITHALNNGDDETDVSPKTVVIMAGDELLTCLATPVDRRKMTYPGFRHRSMSRIFRSLILLKSCFMFANNMGMLSIRLFLRRNLKMENALRDLLSTKKVPEKKTVEVNRGTFPESFGIRKEGNSFASVIKGATRLEEKVEELPPAIVLEDDCLSTKDVSKSLMGRVKVFASLVNLRMALSNEGFADIKIKYMGEFWVLLDNTFHIAAKWGDLLDVDDQEDSCFHSKRLCVHTKVVRNILEEFKIIHRGKIYWIRANEAPDWVPEFNDDVKEELDDDINSNDDGPLEHVREINEKEDKSDDPFNIYPILNKLADTGGYDIKSEGSLKYPPGFSPAELNEDNGSGIKEIRQQNDEGNSANIRPKDHISESVCSGKFKSSEVPREGGSILSVMEEIVKVGTIMGYNMEGCTKNITKIIASQGEDMVHR